MRQITITPVSSPLKAAFAISRGSKSSAETVLVEITQDGQTGRGECVPYARYQESRVSVVAQLSGLEREIEEGLTRQDLQRRLPAGAAKCAVDCALWDLEAKLTGTPVWELAGLPEPKPLPTTMTISLDEPEVMANAAKATHAKILKVKLGGPDDLSRIEAVRRARPDAKLVLDGNEGLDPEDFPQLAAIAADLGVVLIEQPFPAGQDGALTRRPGFVAICADESVHTRGDLQGLAKKYDAVNIKLDKAGGLTEAMRMMKEAKRCGLGTMVGCMVAGSISMAPALLLGQTADLIDLDGPLWLAQDVPHKLRYHDGIVSPPSRDLWG
ncbi:MAG: dipeptide epimerase [Hyphomonas sp.]|jgi:L-alanine-DL-glutamate epimerase-like enolase superfamily enzyme|nr:dipeptide epimerase [Hyphomonas sp.]